jgi:glycosyltransferase involved in cell wall biosynthesis
MQSIIAIIPCYNEAARIDISAFLKFSTAHDEIILYFINDGSTDDTGEILKQLHQQSNGKISFHQLESNVGKGEAIRQGILFALEHQPDFIGYLDADLSTPLAEFKRLADLAIQKEADVVFGSRIKTANTDIKRSISRHYIGRFIATIIDTRFRFGIYDTQCGAKVFKATSLPPILQKPFLTSWFFDVEVFHRLRNMKKSNWHEEPLLIWENKSQSKLNIFSFPLVCKELFKLIFKNQHA